MSFEHILQLLSSFAIIYFLFLIAKYKKDIAVKDEVILRYQLMNNKHEDTVLILTKELKDIASLNKFCIERWEKSVLENQNLLSLFKDKK
jgi:hypothetical protein